jgi:hypothetical protein
MMIVTKKRKRNVNVMKNITIIMIVTVKEDTEIVTVGEGTGIATGGENAIVVIGIDTTIVGIAVSQDTITAVG